MCSLIWISHNRLKELWNFVLLCSYEQLFLVSNRFGCCVFGYGLVPVTVVSLPYPSVQWMKWEFILEVIFVY